MNNYFEIKNLKCSYNGKVEKPKVVLRVDELNIPRGQIVFIVGQSGCGKSTILETLGLMNDTMLKENNSQFDFFPVEDERLDYLDIWNKSNSLVSKIRLDYFSFIFQQTNLMRNFNIYENIAITKMMQGASEVECKRTTNKILHSIGLGEFVIMNSGTWDKKSKVFDKAHEASGGQQQRIAFARAMVSEFRILFCDEPTGNLDPKTADKLMCYLHDELKNKADCTAVIVSHDLNLAVKYGDRIIKIFKQIDDDEHFGLINNGSVFIKKIDSNSPEYSVRIVQWENNGIIYSEKEVVKKIEEVSDEIVQ